MFRSGDRILCPVIAWAKVVQRVRSIEGSSDNSEVCLFQESSSKQSLLLRADHVQSKLRAIVDLIGEEKLGFNKEDIGLHSIRSGGAMAMFLLGTSIAIIQRVGRWSSEAFLEYIREQVETFTLDVSKNMIRYEEFFNLSNDKQNNSTHITLESSNINDDENEDGRDSVPFSIKFNELALQGRVNHK